MPLTGHAARQFGIGSRQADVPAGLGVILALFLKVILGGVAV